MVTPMAPVVVVIISEILPVLTALAPEILPIVQSIPPRIASVCDPVRSFLCSGLARVAALSLAVRTPGLSGLLALLPRSLALLPSALTLLPSSLALLRPPQGFLLRNAARAAKAAAAGLSVAPFPGETAAGTSTAADTSTRAARSAERPAAAPTSPACRKRVGALAQLGQLRVVRCQSAYRFGHQWPRPHDECDADEDRGDERRRVGELWNFLDHRTVFPVIDRCSREAETRSRPHRSAVQSRIRDPAISERSPTRSIPR